MIKKSALIMAALIFTLSLSPFVFAQSNDNTKTPVITRRQHRQQRRIANGVKSGQLTAREAANDERREEKLHQDKKEAKADGHVTQQERRQLRHEENRDSRKIYRTKHNNRKRG